MPATAAAMTVEQFLALPEEAAFRRELIRGEMAEMRNARLFSPDRQSAAERVDCKADIYLARGTQAVWAVYPEHGSLTAHDPGGVSRRLRAADTLAEPELLPGFSLALSELFKPLT
jgi:Uma2 family endonuclease